MKIERLIGIVFYLINRKLVTANQLAEHFNVSKRTILRDIDVLTLSGFPIYSEIGSKGGYSMSPDYRVNEKILDLSNTQYMLLALKSLKSVYGENKVIETYEKVKHIYDLEIEESHIDIDFSVINENESVISKVSELRTALIKKQTILFEYTNQKIQKRLVKGNVIYVYYKWYAWYAFVHDLGKDMNLMFKVVRMDNIQVTNDYYTNVYDSKKLLEVYSQSNQNEKIPVVMEYPAKCEKLVTEYFGGVIIDSQNKVIKRKIHIKEDDFMIFSLILGLGDKVRIVSPSSYRKKVVEHLRASILKNTLNGDI